MKKTILVTGSVGFIGFHVSQALIRRGDFVIGLDNFNHFLHTEKIKKDRDQELKKITGYYASYEADIIDKDSLEKIFSGHKIDTICHLAGQAGARQSVQNPNLYIKVNIEGSTNIFELAKKYNIKNIVYCSTSSVYGSNPNLPWKEEDELKPINHYGVTKAATELIASTYHHKYGMNMTGLRYFTVYGPWGRPDMAYFKFTDGISKGESIDVYDEEKMKRDFTYIDDIVAGTLAAIDNPKPCEIYNLGNSHQEKLGKLIELIEKELGKKAKKNHLPKEAGDFFENFADINKAKKDLGFEPKTSIEEGIKKFVEWYKEYYKI